MTNKPFDPTKPVQTRDGRKARIICTNVLGNFPILALIEYIGHNNTLLEHTYSYHSDGKVDHEKVDHGSDLVNIPQKRWVNLNYFRRETSPGIYIEVGGVYQNKEAADALACESRVACVEIDWPE
jgi:hypothetical protein